MWRGIAFRLSATPLVADMQQVREVLSDLQVSRVPGARGWVRGLANVRGQLVTVVDLAGFLGLPQPVRSRGQRALFVERGDLQVALLVDEVFGVRQFPVDGREPAADVPVALAPYVDGAVPAADERWLVADLSRLLANPSFLDAAA